MKNQIFNTRNIGRLILKKLIITSIINNSTLTTNSIYAELKTNTPKILVNGRYMTAEVEAILAELNIYQATEIKSIVIKKYYFYNNNNVLYEYPNNNNNDEITMLTISLNGGSYAIAFVSNTDITEANSKIINTSENIYIEYISPSVSQARTINNNYTGKMVITKFIPSFSGIVAIST